MGGARFVINDRGRAKTYASPDNIDSGSARLMGFEQVAGSC